jgi:hypothetical protein
MGVPPTVSSEALPQRLRISVVLYAQHAQIECRVYPGQYRFAGFVAYRALNHPQFGQ